MRSLSRTKEVVSCWPCRPPPLPSLLAERSCCSSPCHPGRAGAPARDRRGPAQGRGGRTRTPRAEPRRASTGTPSRTRPRRRTPPAHTTTRVCRTRTPRAGPRRSPLGTPSAPLCAPAAADLLRPRAAARVGV
eukprot:gene20841-biopygen10141